MDILRRHAFLIVCVLIAVAGVVLIVTGVRAMPKVVTEMQKADNLHRNLRGLQEGAVDLGAIEAAEERIASVKSDRDQVFQRVRKMYGYELNESGGLVRIAGLEGTSDGYELLVDGVLPEGDGDKRLSFRSKYVAQMNAMLESLHAGRVADRADYSDFESRIGIEEAEEREARALRGAGGPADTTGPAETRAGVLTKVGAKKNARARASLAAAQKIYLYAVRYEEEQLPDVVSSLDVLPVMQETSTIEAPELEDVWWAQLGYWIQRDVVRAIASLNDERAEQISGSGGSTWVGVLPVKEVIAIRVLVGFVPADGEEVYGAPPGGYDAALPPGTPETAFTHSGESGTYEVGQFTVKLVMDVRDLPALIGRITRNRSHTLLRVSYEAVRPNRSMVGKIYGSDPVVNVVMDFETILLGDVFRRWMPQSVCETYGIDCPERAEGE